MRQLVSDAVESRNERLVELPLYDHLVMPGKVVAEVEVDGAVAVEGDQWSLEVVEDMKGARVHPEDLNADGTDDLSNEADESVVMFANEGGTAGGGMSSAS